MRERERERERERGRKRRTLSTQDHTACLVPEKCPENAGFIFRSLICMRSNGHEPIGLSQHNGKHTIYINIGYKPIYKEKTNIK